MQGIIIDLIVFAFTGATAPVFVTGGWQITNDNPEMTGPWLFGLIIMVLGLACLVKAGFLFWYFMTLLG